MIFLNIIAEGHSEEEFVRKVLTPHLANFNVFVKCQKVHTGGSKLHPVKGGLGKVPKYNRISKTLERWLKADRGRENVYYSTMLDLYAFPKDDQSPYTNEIQQLTNKYEKIKKLEAAISEKHNIDKFIPYVQLHEFETLLLVDLDKLKVMYPFRLSNINKLKNEIKNKNVELINEGPHSAPSKRIIDAIPEHNGQKCTVGPMVLEDIGIQMLKNNCIHFNEWVTMLEMLANNNNPIK